jgi:hypothetical protein
MKNCVYVFLIFGLSCCNSFKGLPGTYVRKGKDYKYTLTISPDSTFNLVSESFHARSGCKGKWNLTRDTLLLQCSDEAFPAQIASGYMTERDKKVIVLGEKKLKLGQEILKRVK